MSIITHPVTIIVEAIVILVGVLTFFITRFILPHNKRYLDMVAQVIFNQLHKTYFCGYHFDDVCWQGFFPRYRNFVDFGFCGTTSALSMLALWWNPSARLIEMHYPSKNEEPFWRHRFVEFRVASIWFVLDPCWLQYGITLRKHYYKEVGLNSPNHTIAHVCKHREFWSYRFSHEMRKKLQNPETSWQFYEIFNAYCWIAGDDKFFPPDLETMSADWDGKCPSAGFFIYDDERILFTSRIMREYMAKPTRKHPKGHTIRKARLCKKLVRREYADFCARMQKTA